jgi:hypothetical protein
MPTAATPPMTGPAIQAWLFAGAGSGGAVDVGEVLGDGVREAVGEGPVGVEPPGVGPSVEVDVDVDVVVKDVVSVGSTSK